MWHNDYLAPVIFIGKTLNFAQTGEWTNASMAYYAQFSGCAAITVPTVFSVFGIFFS